MVARLHDTRPAFPFRRSCAEPMQDSAIKQWSTTSRKSLGVTSVELMPIQTFIEDKGLLDKGLHILLGL